MPHFVAHFKSKTKQSWKLGNLSIVHLYFYYCMPHDVSYIDVQDANANEAEDGDNKNVDGEAFL